MGYGGGEKKFLENFSEIRELIMRGFHLFYYTVKIVNLSSLLSRKLDIFIFKIWGYLWIYEKDYKTN